MIASCQDIRGTWHSISGAILYDPLIRDPGRGSLPTSWPIVNEKYFANGDNVESVGLASLLLRIFLIVLAGKPIRLESSSALRRPSAISKFKFLLSFSDMQATTLNKNFQN